MKITRAFFSPGVSAFYFDDQRAILEGARPDGFRYEGRPLTPGFSAVRMPGQCVTVHLALENGRVARGDCVAVQYSGAGGRDPLFKAREQVEFLEKNIRPLLEGREIGRFRDTSSFLEEITIGGRRLHTALRYGLSQAVLEAVAEKDNILPAEVVCREYGLALPAGPVPVFGQSGDNRRENADKMILKEVDALPHGLINNVEHKLGRRGELLREYLAWLVARIERLRRRQDYRPAIHLDLYGTLGLAFGKKIGPICDYLAGLEEIAGPHPLYIEEPVDMDGKEAQIDFLGRLTATLRERGSAVRIVADEWCNTSADIRDFADAGACDMVQVKTPDLGAIHQVVESILYCREKGVEAYQGGSCNETAHAAACCTQVAMAARPDRLLAKPGMSFDEGFSIVTNEMRLVLDTLAARRGAPGETAAPCSGGDN